MYRPSNALQSLCLVLPLQVRVEDLLVQRDLLVAPGGAVQTLVVLRRLRDERTVIGCQNRVRILALICNFIKVKKRVRSVTRKTCVGVQWWKVLCTQLVVSTKLSEFLKKKIRNPPTYKKNIWLKKILPPRAAIKYSKHYIFQVWNASSMLKFAITQHR